jgi:tetratricopeptide (TPR) repeat protein
MGRKYKPLALLIALVVAVSTACTQSSKDTALSEYKRGESLALQGDDNQSLKALDNSIRIDPKYAPAHLDRARVLNRLGRFQQALEECNVCIALDPKFAAAYSIRSHTLSYLKQYRSALDDANKAISLTSATSPYVARAQAYLGLGQCKLALADCNKDLAVENDPQTLYVRAQVYLCLAEYQNAVKDCTAAIEQYPKGAGFYETRATAYLKLHDPVAASKDWETFKSLKFKKD